MVTDSDSSDGDEGPSGTPTSPSKLAPTPAADAEPNAAPSAPDGADTSLLSAAEAKRQQLAARRAKRAAVAREKGKGAVKRFIPRVLPEGAEFCSELRAMMYGFGDSCHPSLQVAAALEADAMRYAGGIVHMLRELSGGKAISLKLITQHMGGAVAVYFRWKAMKKMAKGSRGGGEGGGEGGESPIDDEELDEWGGGAAAAGKSQGDASASVGAVGTPPGWDDTPPAPVSDGLARGMLLAGEEDEEEADLAAELEANAELELREEAVQGGAAQAAGGGGSAPVRGFRAKHFPMASFQD